LFKNLFVPVLEPGRKNKKIGQLCFNQNVENLSKQKTKTKKKNG